MVVLKHFWVGIKPKNKEFVRMLVLREEKTLEDLSDESTG